MGRKRSYTDEQEKEIVELLRKGIRSADIARKYKLHCTTIRDIKKKNCPDLVKPLKRISDEDRAEILKLILEGYQYIDIAIKFNVSDTSVTTIARKNGIPAKSYQPKDITIELENEFINLVKNGMTASEAANILGFSHSSGYRMCEAHNISLDRRREPLTDEEKLEIQRLYDEGCTYEFIREKLNISNERIRQYAVINRLNKCSIDQVNLLCKLVFENSISIKEAAEIVDIGLNTAYYYVDKYKKEHNLK